MNHKQRVELKRDILRLCGYYKMYPDAINYLGRPEDILKALILLEEKGNRVRYWAGGDCEKIIGKEGKFDVVLEIPSFSEYEDSYRRVLTLDKFGENKLRITSIYPKDCTCKYSIYFKGVGKLDGTCKHTIAAILFLQDNWDEFNKKYLKGNFELEEIYRPYMEESFYWASGLENYIDLFKKLENKLLKAAYKKDIFYNKIWNDKFPEKRKPLFFSLDETVRDRIFREYCKRFLS
jgi:hypothetical protein